jgi:hypothetical protein
LAVSDAAALTRLLTGRAFTGVSLTDLAIWAASHALSCKAGCTSAAGDANRLRLALPALALAARATVFALLFLAPFGVGVIGE